MGYFKLFLIGKIEVGLRLNFLLKRDQGLSYFCGISLFCLCIWESFGAGNLGFGKV